MASIPPSGAVAQLAKAPVSKTGDSRFESWLPRFGSPGRMARCALYLWSMVREAIDKGSFR